MKYCKKCENKVNINLKYCKYCGEELNQNNIVEDLVFDENFNKAMEYYENKEYDNAEEYFKKALNKDSKKTLYQFWNAYIKIEKGNYKEATSLFDKFLKKNKKNTQALYWRGYLSLKVKPQKADKYFKKLEKVDKKNILNLYVKALKLEARNNYQNLIKVYDEILERNPGDIDIKLKELDACMDLKYYEKALNLIETLEEEDFREKEIEIYMGLKEYEKALNIINTLESKENIKNSKLKVKIYTELGEDEKAIKTIDEMLKTEKIDIDLLNKRLELIRKSKDDKEILKSINLILNVKKDLDLELEKLDLLEKYGDEEEVKEHIKHIYDNYAVTEEFKEKNTLIILESYLKNDDEKYLDYVKNNLEDFNESTLNKIMDLIIKYGKEDDAANYLINSYNHSQNLNILEFAGDICLKVGYLLDAEEIYKDVVTLSKNATKALDKAKEVSILKYKTVQKELIHIPRPNKKLIENEFQEDLEYAEALLKSEGENKDTILYNVIGNGELWNSETVIKEARKLEKYKLNNREKQTLNYYLGFAYLVKEDISNLAKYFTESIKYSGEKEIYSEYVLELIKSYMKDDLINVLDEMLKYDKNPSVLAFKAEGYYFNDDYENYDKILKEAKECDEKNKKLRSLMKYNDPSRSVGAYFKMKQKENDEKYFEENKEILENNDTSPKALLEKIRLYHRVKDYENMEKYLKILLNDNPLNEWGIDYKFTIFIDKNAPNDMLKYGEELLEYDNLERDTKRIIHFYIGYAYLMKGNNKEMVKHFAKAVEYKVENKQDSYIITVYESIEQYRKEIEIIKISYEFLKYKEDNKELLYYIATNYK